MHRASRILRHNPRDLFFAQGVVHAQDRWWQMEFQRHTALGRIGELTGYNESVLRNDTFIRTSGWNRAAQRDLEAGQKANSPSLPILTAYADGVNAYIEGKSGPIWRCNIRCSVCEASISLSRNGSRCTVCAWG